MCSADKLDTSSYLVRYSSARTTLRFDVILTCRQEVNSLTQFYISGEVAVSLANSPVISPVPKPMVTWQREDKTQPTMKMLRFHLLLDMSVAQFSSCLDFGTMEPCKLTLSESLTLPNITRPCCGVRVRARVSEGQSESGRVRE